MVTSRNAAVLCDICLGTLIIPVLQYVAISRISESNYRLRHLAHDIEAWFWLAIDITPLVIAGGCIVYLSFGGTRRFVKP